MSIFGSLLFFKFVLLAGLAAWMTVIVINNATAFATGVATIGAMMGMRLFDQPPAIKTPLLARRVSAESWHKLVYSVILLVQIIVAALLLFAAYSLLAVLAGALDLGLATARANAALSALLAMTFIFALGGSWFVYYVRQEGTQIMHFVLMGVATAGAIAINLPTP